MCLDGHEPKRAHDSNVGQNTGEAFVSISNEAGEDADPRSRCKQMMLRIGAGRAKN